MAAPTPPPRRLRPAALSTPAIAPDAPAYIYFTSGTTGRPKGVLTRHSGLEAQIDALQSAWGWSAADRILNVLPLHHVHGVMGVALSSVWAGATLEMAPKFDAGGVWAALTRPSSDPHHLTLFMAVPTVYSRLIERFEKAEPAQQAAWGGALRDPSSPIRLMVSGSAALPASVMRRWAELSGHTLLERYGMTEFGLAVSNPLMGERQPGRVGRPVGTFQARIVDEVDGVTPVPDGETGELQLRGPGVFDAYWDRPEATAECFTADGWFRTGDVAVRHPAAQGVEGSIAIAGRMSADIIKSGGYKLSALDIERELLEHPDIAEIAVLGVPDATYGERVGAVIVRKSGGGVGVEGLDLKKWAAARMAPYKIPSVLRVVGEIPRNAMGKVNKKQLRGEIFGPEVAAAAAAEKAAKAASPLLAGVAPAGMAPAGVVV